MSTMDVHPVADLFPMLAEDELAELAADIKARGLIQPIVLDSEGRVLDGRNRLAACDLAGVKPEYVTYEGDDPDGYALAVNIARRHLSTGARAMIAARASNLEYGHQSKIASLTDLGKSRVNEAALVLKWAAHLADDVISGATPLSVALEEARTKKREHEERQAKMDRLRDEAPDLLTLVDEERMSVDDADAALDARLEKARQEAERERNAVEERQRQEREAARQANTKLAEAVAYLDASTSDDWRALTAEQWRTGACDATPPAREAVTPDNLRAIATGLQKLADRMQEEAA